MSARDDFEFLNSSIWLKYTQSIYRTLEETKYRLEQVNASPKDWDEIKKTITRYRKTAAIPFFLSTIDKKFWFFPSDSIYQKAHEVEKKGLALHEKIIRESAFASDFILDATIEEAITSAIYEGANSTRAKAKELIESDATPKNKDEWMLINNYKAMLWVRNNHSRDVSLDLIKEVHEIVTKNTLTGDDLNFSGKFRTDTVFVRAGAEVKHEGIDFRKIEDCLKEVSELTTKNPRYFPPLLKGIILHYFLAYIHPFFDGNGRTARTLFYFKAIKNNLKFVEILSLSAYLKNHGKQYEKSFDKVVESEYDITYFIDFNLDSLKSALDKVAEKVEFLQKISTLREGLGVSAQQIGLLQRMALHKFRVYDIEGYAKLIDKSREIARQELKQLSDLGLLEEIKVSKKNVYRIKKDALISKLKEAR